VTFNQLIERFRLFAAGHKFIKTFGTGEEWEIETLKTGEEVAYLRKGVLYQLFYAIPKDVTGLGATDQWRFEVSVMDIVKKDKSNEQEVLSDTRQTLKDFEIFCRDSTDITLVGDPVAVPFKESYGDWCAGWSQEMVFETDTSTSLCDLPVDGVTPTPNPNYATVKDQDGNIVTRLYPGQEYSVIIASGIDEGNASTTYTIKVVDIN